MPNFMACSRQAQHGGMPHRGTALCSHFSRSFFGYACERSLCAAQLYVDVIGAFDTVLRQLLFQNELSDEVIAFVLNSLGMDAEVMHKLAQHISNKDFLDSSGMSKFTQMCFQKCHEDTWISTQGLQEIATTEVGSIPGDPLGDIAFNFVSSRVHTDLESQLLAAGLLSEVEAPPCLSGLTGHELGPLTMFDNVYVDDAAFMILADSAVGIINKAVPVAQIVRSVYSSSFC